MTANVLDKVEDSEIKSHGKCQCGEDLVCAWEWEFGSKRHAEMMADREHTNTRTKDV